MYWPTQRAEASFAVSPRRQLPAVRSTKALFERWRPLSRREQPFSGSCQTALIEARVERRPNETPGPRPLHAGISSGPFGQSGLFVRGRPLPPRDQPLSETCPKPSYMSREGVPLVVIQRQLGHADLGVTSVYLRGIDNTEIVHAVHERPAPMIPAANGLRLTH